MHNGKIASKSCAPTETDNSHDSRGEKEAFRARLERSRRSGGVANELNFPRIMPTRARPSSLLAVAFFRSNDAMRARGIHDLAGDALLFVEKDRHKLFGTAIAFSSNKLSDGEEGRNRESEERAWKPASFPVVNCACSLCRRRLEHLAKT